jgi:hypothetical protein
MFTKTKGKKEKTGPVNLLAIFGAIFPKYVANLTVLVT